MHCPLRARPRALLISVAVLGTLAAGAGDAGGAADAGGDGAGARATGAPSTPPDSTPGGAVVTPAQAAAQLRAGGLPQAVTDAPPALIDGRTVDPRLAPGPHGTLAVEDAGTVAAAIGTDPADGFALATGAGTLRVIPSDVAERATPATVVAGEAAVYANTAPATDSVVRPTATGVETFTQLRDPGAPATTRYRVALAGDEHLTALPEGGVGVVADSAVLAGAPGGSPAGGAPGETTVGMLLAGDPPVVAAAGPPTARDAAGRAVPVAYAIEGDTLAVTVAAPADAAYPVTVDPSWTATPGAGLDDRRAAAGRGRDDDHDRVADDGGALEQHRGRARRRRQGVRGPGRLLAATRPDRPRVAGRLPVRALAREEVVRVGRARAAPVASGARVDRLELGPGGPPAVRHPHAPPRLRPELGQGALPARLLAVLHAQRVRRGRPALQLGRRIAPVDLVLLARVIRRAALTAALTLIAFAAMIFLTAFKSGTTLAVVAVLMTAGLAVGLGGVRVARRLEGAARRRRRGAQ